MAVAATPSPEDRALFDRWELHLLTGSVDGNVSRAFSAALKAITWPGVLRLALEHIDPGDTRRRDLVNARLLKLERELDGKAD